MHFLRGLAHIEVRFRRFAVGGGQRWLKATVASCTESHTLSLSPRPSHALDPNLRPLCTLVSPGGVVEETGEAGERRSSGMRG